MAVSSFSKASGRGSMDYPLAYSVRCVVIHPDATLSIARLPLNRIVIREMEPRELSRIETFVNLMGASEMDIDPLMTVRPIKGGYYEVENGHHRFLAYLILGRAVAPCVIIEE